MAKAPPFKKKKGKKGASKDEKPYVPFWAKKKGKKK